MRYWNLYIDESGDFSAPEGQALVAGVLLPFLTPGVDPSLTLRGRVRAALPELPWPLHARHLNSAPLWLFWCPARLPRELVECYEQLNAQAPQLCERIEDGIARWEETGSRSEPTSEQLKQLHTQAERALTRAQLDQLFSYARERRIALFRAFDASLKRSEGFALWASRWPSPHPPQTRYLEQLSALLERALDSLSFLPGPHRVNLYVAHRYIEVSQASLTPVLLAQVVEQLRIKRPGGHDVGFSVPHKTPDYRHRQTSAGLVVADHLANQLWADVGRFAGSPSLSNLSHTCARYGLSDALEPAQTAWSAALPFACAAGWPRELMLGQRSMDALNDAPPWMAEQASAWAPLLR